MVNFVSIVFLELKLFSYQTNRTHKVTSEEEVRSDRRPWYWKSSYLTELPDRVRFVPKIRYRTIGVKALVLALVKCEEVPGRTEVWLDQIECEVVLSGTEDCEVQCEGQV